MNCPFCGGEGELFGNSLAYVKEDAYPVSSGHLLIIPRRHVPDWFELSMDEQTSIVSLLETSKKYLDARYHPDGYNIGVNCGEAAGQTIFHVHLHLIPRYAGDVPNPRGGVRAVISVKKEYPVLSQSR